MPSPLFVGIDIGSEDNVVCCLTRDDKKRPISRFTVTNNRPGILELKDRINKLACRRVSSSSFGFWRPKQKRLCLQSSSHSGVQEGPFFGRSQK